jgi:DNA-binding transcriptional MerR regulator
MDDLTIKRLYYTRSEVSTLMNIPPHVLKAWEQRFPKLHPMKSQSGRILFRPSDLELVRRIHSWKKAGYTDEKIQRLILVQEMECQESGEATLRIISPQKQLYTQMIEGLKEILHILES